MSDWASPAREELALGQIKADIALQQMQAPWEPWKAMETAFGAGATVASAMLALAVYVVSRLH